MSEIDASRAFLWEPNQPLPDDATFIPRAGDWWEQYYSELVAGTSLSESALRELTKSSRAIAGLLPNPALWDRPRPFKGVVVGAVQSGKTQSMMGVAATALDNGYKIVIILAGLKDDLRTQTARRFNTQLLLQSDAVPGIQGATTLGKPVGATGRMRGFAPPYHLDCHDYAPLLPKMRAALKAGMPCIVVIKKHPTSLNDLRGVLREVYAAIGSELLPTLVLDDECDEATVPAGEQEKAVPEGILGLWNESSTPPPVAYVGYTATAAANLLQNPSWPLYPHWVYLLRYPAATETAVCFRELSSDRWYSGCNCFYSDFGSEPAENDNFLVSATVEPGELRSRLAQNPSLQEAFRAYFVSGAYRLAIDPSRSFDGTGRLPEPHSMMVHTSAVQEDHSRWANGIFSVFGRIDHPDGSAGFDPDTLSGILQREDAEWQVWYRRFTASCERIYEERAHDGPQRLASWEQVKSRLHDVFSNVRLKVVNSDSDGASLDYKPALGLDGRPARRPDVYVVAIGGSRLSRGITVEGLCVSYFARTANVRHDDTVLQMSRWFGYRGSHLEFCRIFTTTAGFLGLREVADNDQHLRAQLAGLMAEKRAPADATVVFLASPYALPTAKMGEGLKRDLSFSPFTKVLARVECRSLAKANEDVALALVSRIRGRSPRRVRRGSGVDRGLMSRGWSAAEVADILDSLQYEDHNPDGSANLMSECYRPTDTTRPTQRAIDPREDPYQVAAYLRYWARERPQTVPAFNVCFGVGEMDEKVEPFDFSLLNRQVTEEAIAIGGWTGASSSWRGDALFDNPDPAQLDAVNERKLGSSGLLLLYVIHRDARGKNGNGRQLSHHTPLLGIAIPAGGPDFVRVLSPGGRRDDH